MIVYRLGKTQYSDDLSGEGARLYGGRWNPVGTACLYTSQSRALAVLEFSVNLNILEIPNSLSFTVIEIQDNQIFNVNNKDLPIGWNSFPAPTITKIFGNELLRTSDKAIIKIPSVIIPTEFNFLLNPYHKSKTQFKIIDIESFIYDSRIKSSI